MKNKPRDAGRSISKNLYQSDRMRPGSKFVCLYRNRDSKMLYSLDAVQTFPGKGNGVPALGFWACFVCREANSEMSI